MHKNVTLESREEEEGATHESPVPVKKNVDMTPYLSTPNDSKDPSYTRLVLPYSVICKMRYQDAAKKQTLQFLKELKAHESLRDTGLEGIRIHRIFCNPIIRPLNAQEKVTLTQQQKERIQQLLNEP